MMELHPRHQERHTSEQEIVIARNPDRSEYLGYMVLHLVFLLVFAFLFIVFLVNDGMVICTLGFRFVDVGESLKSYLSILYFMFLFGGMAWNMLTRHILAQDPPLVINRLGMHLGTLPMVLDRVSLSWEQIGIISSRHVFTDTYLCLCPKHPGAFFASLGFWRQIPARLAFLVLGAPIVVPQSTMNCSAQDILNLLRERYASTLDDYAIVLKC